MENLRGWLTTVVGRVCLDMLRARRARREEALQMPSVTLEGPTDPEQEALLADSVGLALLETLSPAERLAFVLHDMFGLPFEEIAPIVERNPAATRQLASRARRRVRVPPQATAETLAHQREVVDAFLAASREGDFEALVSVLDPNVVFRADRGPTSLPARSRSAGPRRWRMWSSRAARRLRPSRGRPWSTGRPVPWSWCAGGCAR